MARVGKQISFNEKAIKIIEKRGMLNNRGLLSEICNRAIINWAEGGQTIEELKDEVNILQKEEISIQSKIKFLKTRIKEKEEIIKGSEKIKLKNNQNKERKEFNNNLQKIFRDKKITEEQYLFICDTPDLELKKKLLGEYIK